jgi:hypothetical protein
MAETESALRVLHQRARSLRVAVDKVNPDPPRTGSGRSGSWLSAFTWPFQQPTPKREVRFPGRGQWATTLAR